MKRLTPSSAQDLLVRASYVLLAASIIGWPVSQLTFARGEPPTVLALSWIAIILAMAGNVLGAVIFRAVTPS